jgi:hypothetical protein
MNNQISRNAVSQDLIDAKSSTRSLHRRQNSPNLHCNKELVVRILKKLETRKWGNPLLGLTGTVGVNTLSVNLRSEKQKS